MLLSVCRELSLQIELFKTAASMLKASTNQGAPQTANAMPPGAYASPAYAPAYGAPAYGAPAPAYGAPAPAYGTYGALPTTIQAGNLSHVFVGVLAK